ncbi:biotin--[acetyl-CoA-carboxylase] ligase [Helicobacter sp. MIT 21-1697]|uniref:biotin--[acetyl-CoA-carboxylase] ligase n=1 Tax=Helicobacter sp. MIT 21-1697 TaxID=2993733 RepID=UPI00224AA9AD|nr:biotin--[acetyl-CoA-carboxylase] ligase [Helicobacter sp. MIT 21-1697]MCX2716429.1 biotin--[acetyl-CoA-carboxylase] ligase [Helicobacter sp. MIT 21-1697]
MLNSQESPNNSNASQGFFTTSFIALLKEHIYHFDTLPSTQTYAIEKIKSKTLKAPFCIHATQQTQGIGSRGNQWESVPRGLMFSFALPLASLPQDLKIESSSIFFGVILQQFLLSLGANVWLKYPNDLYRDTHKIGGILTQKIRNSLVCGMGINLYDSSNVPKSQHYATLEKSISANIEHLGFLSDFFQSFEKFISWKQIFSIYKLEFHKNNSYFFHFQDKRIYLKDTMLNEDGSLSIDGHKIYSLR